MLKICKNKFRALVDTGAAVSLISKKMYDNLFPRPKLCKNDIPTLQAANGNSLIAIGYVNISFKISGLVLEHKLYVTKGLNRNQSQLAQEEKCSIIF